MRTDKYRPNQPPYLLYGLLGLSIAMNVLLAARLLGGGDEDTLEDVAALEEPVAEPSVPGEAQALTADVPVVEMAASAAAAEGWQVVHGTVTHSLARTFQGVDEDDGDAVGAVFSRLFMWDLDLRRDLQKGDEIWAVYRVDSDGAVDMPVAWYRSNKLGATMKAYRHQAADDAFASYWYADGTEVPLRMAASPIDDYEQITSLLKDRPSHKGMDFKAPVGTPVVSPKAGTVTRVNWNHSNNGNCVEVRFADGTLAKFLHLDALDVQEGQHVKSGQRLAASGNTGHSTAPHLHYQLNKGEKVLDPLEYHDTLRRKLDSASAQSFEVTKARYDTMLATEIASL
jgi:murein DD-endopeptidase